jgi:hypothetical protein
MKPEKKRKPRPPGSNNLAGGPTLAQQARRNQIEDAIAVCMSTSQDMAEVELRIEQAVRRASMVSLVLLPALERVQSARVRVEQLHTDLAEYWQSGQARRWK